MTKIISFRCEESVYDEIRCRFGSFRDLLEPMCKKYVKLLSESTETPLEYVSMKNEYDKTREEVDMLLSRLNGDF